MNTAPEPQIPPLAPSSAPAKLQAQDGPILASRVSSALAKGAEHFVYSERHCMVSYDCHDLLRCVTWAPSEIDKLKGLSEPVDWEEVAEQLGGTKTAFQCFAQYYNSVKSHSGPWTAEEEKKLLRLVDSYQGHYWSQIAAELGTNRSPMECLKHYQQALNPSLVVSGSWEPEEDKRLAELVSLYGPTHWSRIATKLQGRTPEQCMDRWRNSVHSREDVVLGAWREEEERSLFLAALVCQLPLSTAHAHTLSETTALLATDTNTASATVPSSSSSSRPLDRENDRGDPLDERLTWTTVAKLVPGRSEKQCREKWSNALDPTLRDEDYTAEETRLLCELVNTLGEGRWAAIASHLPGRTDASVRKKWIALQAHAHDETAAATSSSSTRRTQPRLRTPRQKPLPSSYGRSRKRAAISTRDFVVERRVAWEAEEAAETQSST